MTRHEAEQLIADYDYVSAECDRADADEMSAAKWRAVYERLIAAMTGEDLTDPLPGRAP